jgi:hypothetical protein
VTKIFSQIPYPPPTLSFGWLLCQIIECRPPKAWALPLSLFLDGSCFSAPSKGTSQGDCKPATRHLLWTHGDAAPRFEGTTALPLKREGIAIGGNHVGCCVLCCDVCCSSSTASGSLFHLSCLLMYTPQVFV